MRINLYTTTNNNESTISEWIDFYKSKVPLINIFIWDMYSKDKTVEIAKEKECQIRQFSDFYLKIDDWKNDCWKSKPCDCVVIAMQNEYIELSPLLFKNATIIKSKGYDFTNIKELKEDPSKRNYDYDKICIFDPKAIKQMNFEGFNCNPLGFVRLSEKNPILYHRV
jgi:hypothetical protein